MDKVALKGRLYEMVMRCPPSSVKCHLEETHNEAPEMKSQGSEWVGENRIYPLGRIILAALINRNHSVKSHLPGSHFQRETIMRDSFHANFLKLKRQLFELPSLFSDLAYCLMVFFN